MNTKNGNAYTVDTIFSQNDLTDICVHRAGKSRHLWGRDGQARELDLASKVPSDSIPVLLGTGLGICAQELLNRGFTVVVADMDPAIRKLAPPPQGALLLEGTVDESVTTLTALSREHQKPLHPIKIPLYQWLQPHWYGALAAALTPAPSDFWEQMAYPKFEHTKPRILFMDGDYFLSGEIRTTLNALEIPHQIFSVPKQGLASEHYVKDLLHSIISFKPDFLLTINHFGLDREGKITALLEKMGLPLASWFVDNPHLILYQYKGLDARNIALFTYDEDNIAHLEKRGFAHVQYLPLATDTKRFSPSHKPQSAAWKAPVSFVGNSMQTSVQNALQQMRQHDFLHNNYQRMAKTFGQSNEVVASHFLHTTYPALAKELEKSSTLEQQLALESLLTWESTRQYRLSCVERILPYSPLIVGDSYWQEQLPATPYPWRYLSSLDYYTQLPLFYPCSTVNFNCTSLQMKGAVNQRVFDVPACGAFVLTDYRKQLTNLFEPGTESVMYKELDEIPALIEQFSKDTAKRMAVINAARKRISAEHTYGHRLTALCATMRKSFS